MPLTKSWTIDLTKSAEEVDADVRKMLAEMARDGVVFGEEGDEGDNTDA